MGWKTIKEHYGIKHAVHIDRDNNGVKRLMIGSSLCHDLFSFSLETGEFVHGALGGIESAQGRGMEWGNQIAADAKSGELLRLIQTQDVFGETVPAWTTEGTRVVEKRAEKLAWPECCTDGQMIYDNTHFPTRKQAEKRLIGESISNMASMIERIGQDAREALERQRWYARSWLGLVRALRLEKVYRYQLDNMRKAAGEDDDHG